MNTVEKKKVSKFKGVAYDNIRNKYYARIAFSGVRYALGRFETYQEAVEAYKEAWNMGAIKLKAWYNSDPEIRGKLGDYAKGTTRFSEEEEKIKSFSHLLDSFEEDNKEYQW